MTLKTYKLDDSIYLFVIYIYDIWRIFICLATYHEENSNVSMDA